ncbi:hypothetical protein CcCBS67573_g08937 [Chytriomyces confervae]|uniref:Homeobox domain-containing protein n=1 Tax=Chytriomyces confervae TaxID=246404 RepID=A0A507EDJ1_9FUNG|nr:hypothetical protein CcCBS67573_g08937 [Chytriomyces confervae]
MSLSVSAQVQSQSNSQVFPTQQQQHQTLSMQQQQQQQQQQTLSMQYPMLPMHDTTLDVSLLLAQNQSTLDQLAHFAPFQPMASLDDAALFNCNMNFNLQLELLNAMALSLDTPMFPTSQMGTSHPNNHFSWHPDAAPLAGQEDTTDFMMHAFHAPASSLPIAPQLPSNFVPFTQRSTVKLPHSPVEKFNCNLNPIVVRPCPPSRSGSLSESGTLTPTTPPLSPPNQSLLVTPPGPAPSGYSRPPRFKPTESELALLMGVFLKNPFPSTNLRKKLADKLNLEPRQIQFWFQNRRALVKATGVSLHKPKRGDQPDCSLSPPPFIKRAQDS